MDYWEFLLQQEGDHSWLPLDTAQVEILEGRYRIMAHSNQAHRPVQIKISQVLPDRRSSKHRSLTRQGQTNGEGLIVVLPFTRLEAGIWDIHCTGIGADALDSDQADWAYAIQLRVLPQGSGEDDDWFADEGSREPIAEPIPPANLIFSEPDLIPPAPAPIPIGVGFKAEDLETALNQSQTDLANGVPLPSSPYNLVLSQTALSGQDGQTIEVRGEIVANHTDRNYPQMALVVRLIDPQTATVVDLSPFPWVGPSLPTPFNLPLAMPAGLSTRLLLGELALMASSEDGVRVLALQRFTVTVDLSALFDTIANQGEPQDTSNLDFDGDGSASAPEAKKEEGEGQIHLPPPRSVPLLTLPRSGLPLPPRIYYPSSHEISVHRPTLPPLGRPLDQSPSPPPPPSLTPDDRSPVEASVDGGAAPTQDLTLPPIPPLRPNREVSTLGSTQAATPKTPPSLLLPSHEAMGFRNLRLQDRFWGRLNNLAEKIQQQAIAKRAAETASLAQGAADPGSPSEPLAFAGEVVIYADETDSKPVPSRDPSKPSDQGLTPPLDLVTPPVPHLDFPPGDWIAGESLRLRVRVPFHPNRLYIKVWVTDPQTRQLVNEPQQVLHLFPNGQGELEGSLSLMVPLGCLEAEVEAIAVDLQTQQESHKASQRFTITPATSEDTP